MASAPAFTSPLRVVLVGASRVGTAVGHVLKSRGHAVTAVWSRTTSSAERAAERLGATIASAPADAVEDADVVLLGIADQAIHAVANDVATGLRDGSIVIHFAGALGIQVLEPVIVSGAWGAALHPVQSIPDVDLGIERLPGCAWGITCSPQIQEWASSFVREQLSGVPVHVAEEDRPLWHAAAVITSNGISALISTGGALLERIGVTDPWSVLGPLATGSLANANVFGMRGEAFTGPVVRGDRATVEAHLTALKERFPELMAEYTLIAKAIVAGAARTARIQQDAAQAMHQLLESA